MTSPSVPAPTYALPPEKVTGTAAAHAVPPPALNALWLAGAVLFLSTIVLCTLRYAFAAHFAWEYTYLTAAEAVDMSVAATRGRMSELLLLLASFLPWLLLCVATAGLASLWVMPYLDATLAAYYLILKRQEGIRLPTPKEYTDV